jgi:hypothetical protein
VPGVQRTGKLRTVPLIGAADFPESRRSPGPPAVPGLAPLFSPAATLYGSPEADALDKVAVGESPNLKVPAGLPRQRDDGLLSGLWTEGSATVSISTFLVKNQ